MQVLFRDYGEGLVEYGYSYRNELFYQGEREPGPKAPPEVIRERAARRAKTQVRRWIMSQRLDYMPITLSEMACRMTLSILLDHAHHEILARDADGDRDLLPCFGRGLVRVDPHPGLLALDILKDAHHVTLARLCQFRARNRASHLRQHETLLPP